MTRFGATALDPIRRELRTPGRETTHLTAREVRFLEAAGEAGVVPFDLLRSWGMGAPATRVMVTRLRTKLAAHGMWIRAVRGTAYAIGTGR
jgi:DNA-binding response OmpR family regulator